VLRLGAGEIGGGEHAGVKSGLLPEILPLEALTVDLVEIARLPVRLRLKGGGCSSFCPSVPTTPSPCGGESGGTRLENREAFPKRMQTAPRRGTFGCRSVTVAY
jgi:hypothetical protein